MEKKKTCNIPLFGETTEAKQGAYRTKVTSHFLLSVENNPLNGCASDEKETLDLPAL